jgi:hypothetical protein
MKWFFGVFFLANLGLALMAYYWEPPRIQPLNNGQGKLPRVSELRIEQSAPANHAASSQPETSAKNAKVQLCGRITGFSSRDIAERFTVKNAALFKRVSVRPGIPEGKAYFWVIVPPFDDRAEALKMLTRLQRAGVDSYLVTEGEFRFAISLGLFESRRYAQNLNARFQKQNIETVLVNMPRNQLSYALAFEAAVQVSRPDILSRLKRYGHRLEVVKLQPCQGVATSSESP